MNNDIKKEDIYNKLRNIFIDRFEKDLEDIGRDNFNEHLLGGKFGLEPRDLVYLYLDIKKEFDIAIPDEDVATGALSTMNNTIEMIYQQLNKSKKETA